MCVYMYMYMYMYVRGIRRLGTSVVHYNYYLARALEFSLVLYIPLPRLIAT